ncbi:MAG: GvpL/GvpF family gas vesicle protein [Myxococcales bacterium]|nr:GvpL/GvpF family gas vesicle protein [Myxococcales bacterium]
MTVSETSERRPAGCYIYAVADAVELSGNTIDASGLEGAEVRSLEVDALAAVISDVYKRRLRPDRRSLSSHMGVIRQVMEQATVLPVSFGVVASSEDDVRRLLAKNQASFVDQLNHVRGKVEMGLRVLWDVPNVFEYFVNTRADLRSARDTIGDIREANRDEMIELGRFFERVLGEERDRYVEQVASVLEGHGIAFVRGRVRAERDVMNLACLVPRAELGEFDRVVGEAASGFDNNFTFDVSGPWAPASFVDVTLET